MLYGVRLFINGSTHYMQGRWDWITEAISLVIPIPLLLFFMATMAKRWRRLVLWSIGIFCVIGAVGMAELFLVHSERATQKAIHLIAVVAIPVLMVLLFIGGRTASREQKILRAGFFVFLLFIVHTNLANVGSDRSWSGPGIYWLCDFLWAVWDTWLRPAHSGMRNSFLRSTKSWKSRAVFRQACCRKKFFCRRAYYRQPLCSCQFCCRRFL